MRSKVRKNGYTRIQGSRYVVIYQDSFVGIRTLVGLESGRALSILARIFFPLQGFFNFLVYIQPELLSEMRKGKNKIAYLCVQSSREDLKIGESINRFRLFFYSTRQWLPLYVRRCLRGMAFLCRPTLQIRHKVLLRWKERLRLFLKRFQMTCLVMFPKPMHLIELILVEEYSYLFQDPSP